MKVQPIHRCGGFRHNGMNDDQHDAVIHTDVSVSDSSVKARSVIHHKSSF